MPVKLLRYTARSACISSVPTPKRTKQSEFRNGAFRDMNKDVQGLIYGASIVSIITAIYMYATGKKDTGIFIGLWAPTFLSLGTFFNTEYRVAKDDSAS